MVPSWTGVCVGAADGVDVTRGFGVDRTGLAIGADPDESIKRRSLILLRDIPLEIFVPYINSNAFKSILFKEVVPCQTRNKICYPGKYQSLRES